MRSMLPSLLTGMHSLLFAVVLLLQFIVPRGLLLLWHESASGPLISPNDKALAGTTTCHTAISHLSLLKLLTIVDALAIFGDISQAAIEP
jgi:hypothetical protein